MARTIFDTIVSVGGIAGEYEALTEAEISSAPGAAYSPPEEFDNFRVVAPRVIQLLGGSPIFFETFQTSTCTIRTPSGQLSSNDAQDGRIYFIKNSGTGQVIVETSGIGTPITSIVTLQSGQSAILLHGDNDNWTTVNTNVNSTTHPVTLSTADPTVNDDANAGFSIGDHWINITSKEPFQLVDSTAGAAIWKSLIGDITINLEVNIIGIRVFT